jgi:UDP-N-acetylglucosamine 1-carboxyvinyltransferase
MIPGERLTVHGGRTLRGPLRVAGFKHALVPLLAAGVLADAPVIIRNAPDIEDTRTLAEILRRLGASVVFDEPSRTLTLDPAGLRGWRIPDELSVRIHGAVYLLPVLLARLGRVAVGALGGCRIGDRRQDGERPLEHMLDVLRRFGARIDRTRGMVYGECRGLTGTTIDLAEYAVPAPHDRRPTGPLYSGASKTALLAAAGATGISVLRNPYPKPDVTELAAALAAAGVPVHTEPDRIVVHGLGGLPRGFDHVLVSDLIETVTFVTCAVALGQPLELSNITADRLRQGLLPELGHLARMGVDIGWNGSTLRVRPPETVAAQDIVAASHSIYSDSQPFFAMMLMGARRPSTITEAVWKDRSQYVRSLVQLGGRISTHGPVITIEPGRVHRAGQHIVAGDVRAAAVAVVAALGIDGPTVIEGVRHLARGYEGLVDTLRVAGARIEADFPERQPVPGGSRA